MNRLQLRPELKGAKRIVVKVGSNVVTKRSGKCDLRKMRIIVEDICELIDSGKEIILVSSGAVNVGKAFLKKMLPDKAVDLQQSASSIGQPKLINRYSNLFEDHQYICSQILLTHDDFRNPQRFKHAQQNIEVLLKNKITPILNENDSISYMKNTLGDNDHLAASAAQMTNADVLLIVTSAKGLFDRDPNSQGATLINHVPFGVTFDNIDMTSKTSVGKGGMESKVHAVNKVTPLGIKAIIASKDNERIVLGPLIKQIGTLFGTNPNYSPEEHKAWLISTKKVNCFIEVDSKSFDLISGGGALYPDGVLNVQGDFYKGDCIDVVHNKEVFAAGISEYDRKEIKKIIDHKNNSIDGALGYRVSKNIIEAQNFVLTGEYYNV